MIATPHHGKPTCTARKPKAKPYTLAPKANGRMAIAPRLASYAFLAARAFTLSSMTRSALFSARLL